MKGTIVPEAYHRIVLARRACPTLPQLCEHLWHALSVLQPFDARLDRFHTYDDTFAIVGCSNADTLLSWLEASAIDWQGGRLPGGPTHRLRMFNLREDTDYADILVSFGVNESDAVKPGLVVDVRLGTFANHMLLLTLAGAIFDAMPADSGFIDPAGSRPRGPDRPASHWVGWGTYVPSAYGSPEVSVDDGVQSEIESGTLVVATAELYDPESSTHHLALEQLRAQLSAFFAAAPVALPPKQAPSHHHAQPTPEPSAPAWDESVEEAASNTIAMRSVIETSLPFRPSDASSFPNTALDDEHNTDLGLTMEDASLQTPRAPYAMPFEARGTVAPPDAHTLEGYAVLCAKLDVDSHLREQTLRRFGFPTSGEANALHQSWLARFEREPELRGRWRAMVDNNIKMLAGSRTEE